MDISTGQWVARAEHERRVRSVRSVPEYGVHERKGKSTKRTRRFAGVSVFLIAFINLFAR